MEVLNKKMWLPGIAMLYIVTINIHEILRKIEVNSVTQS
jgi:hypothetical protein